MQSGAIPDCIFFLSMNKNTQYPLLLQGFTLNELNATTTASISSNGTIAQGRGNAKWFDLFPRVNTNGSEATVLSAKFGNVGILQNVLARTLQAGQAMSQHEYYPIDAVPGQTWQIQYSRGVVGTSTGLTNFHLHVYHVNVFDTLEYRCKVSEQPHLYRQDLIWEIGSGTTWKGNAQTVQPGNGYVKAMQIFINGDITDLTDTILTINVNGVAVMVNALAALFAMYGNNTIVNRTGMRFPIYIEPNTDIDVQITQLSGTRSLGALICVSLLFSGCE